jgi:hypothetical protein
MISLNLKSISRSPLRYGFLLIRLVLVTGLAVFAALWAVPGTARGQMFVSVNSNPGGNGGSRIYQYDPTGSTGTPVMPYFLDNLDHPRGLAFDSAGNLYVATSTYVFDADDNIVGYKGAVLKVSGGVASTFATFTDGFAEGVVTDADKNVFVSSQKFDETASTIYKITPDGVVSTFGFDETIQGSVPGQCFGLAFDSAGNLLAAGADPTLTYGSIYKFTQEGAPYEPTPTGTPGVFLGPGAFSLPDVGPLDLTFDVSGNLFASTFNQNDLTGEIREFGPDGTEITPRFATGLTKEPRGLRFDSDGNLFLAEPGIAGTDPPRVGDLLKFTPGGSFTYFDDGATGDFGTRGNRGPEFLAFAPPAITITPPSTSVVLTFPNTTEPLTTTVVTSLDQNSVPLPSPNFELTGSNLAFDITTPSGEPTPPIIIAFTVPSSLDVSTLKALHYECDTQDPPNCNWVDSTIYPGDPNYPSSPALNTVYANVNSLSPFLVAKFKYGAQVQQPINADGTSVFNAKRGVIPVTFTLTSDGVATCDLPPATISVFRTAGGVVGSIDESTYLLNSDSGSNFRISSCKYVYNLGAKALGPGTYKAYISIGGSVAGSATFALK